MAGKPVVGHGGPRRSAGQQGRPAPHRPPLRHRGPRGCACQSRRRRPWKPHHPGERGTCGPAHRRRLVGTHAECAGRHRHDFGELAVGRHRRAAHVAGRFGEGMSADAPHRIRALAPPWLRYGLIAGIIAFGCTLAANLAVTWMSPAQLCRAGPLIIPLLSLGAMFIFVVMSAAAGFATGRTVSSGPDSALAGLLVGVLGGCAVLVLLPFVPSAQHRFQELASVCSGTGSTFFFGFGSPPPGFVFGSPPPGFVIPTPPEVLAPPSGSAATVLELLGMMVTIVIGIGIAVGVAAVAGLVGRATRSEA